MKIIPASEAAEKIPSGATVALSGSCACSLVADSVLSALERRFLETGLPNQLTLFHPQGIGDKQTLGVSRFAHEGMCRRVIGGHWGLSPAMGRLAVEEKIEASAADYQELTRLLNEKEDAEGMLMDLMEQWDAAQE